MNVIFLIILFILLIVFSFISQQIKAKQSKEMHRMIAPGVKVRTFSGLQGTVVKVEDSTIVLEIADGVETVWGRNAISSIIPKPKEATVGDKTDESSAASASSNTPSEPKEVVRDEKTKEDNGNDVAKELK